MDSPLIQDISPESYRMPAEWDPHQATWLTWPRRESDSYRGEYYDPMLDGYCDLCQKISEAEAVHINVWDSAHQKEITDALNQRDVSLKDITFHPFQSYEPWCRDHGPIFVIRNDFGRNDFGHPKKMVLNWGYNAWGEKYPPYDLDNLIPEKVAQYRNIPSITTGMILEGGSIEVDGDGTLLTTESCLLNANRNPELNLEDIENRLKKFLGVQTILWLKEGVAGDDTDGHIDDLTRFVAPGKVVTILPKHETHPDYRILKANFERLQSFKDNRNRNLEIVSLPCPEPMIRDEVILPASYANFYICNRGVLVPTFRQKQTDAQAISILQECFPGKEVIGVDAYGIIWGLGSLHCLTQQEPNS